MHSVNDDVETGSTKNVKSVIMRFAFILKTCLKKIWDKNSYRFVERGTLIQPFIIIVYVAEIP